MIQRVSIVVSVALMIGGCANKTATLPEPPKQVAQPSEAQPPTAAPAPEVELTVPMLTDASAPAARPAPAIEPKLQYRHVAAAPEPAPVATVVQESSEPIYTTSTLTDPVRIGSAPARISTGPAAPARVAAAPVRAAPAPVSSGPSQMAALRAFEQKGGAPEGTYGYILIDAQDGRVLSDGNADTPLAPASMAKLLAAVAILEAMGPDGRFRTTVLADGQVSGGVLNGDLHLVGDADPSLLSSDLRQLAGRLASAGISKVNGSFYFHSDAIPESSTIDPGQPRGAAYNPGIGGLNLDHNDKNGTAPVSNPGRYTASAFRRYAQAAGVSMPVPKRANGPARGDEVAAHESQTISAILTEMFDISRNMTSEVLGAVAAKKLSRKPTDLRDAARITTEWIKSRTGSIGGSEWAGFEFPNHSGLSNRHRATARQMAAIVKYGYEKFGPAFTSVYEQQASGNIAGVDYSVRAKIGTMRYVRGLGGFVSLNGRDMIFSIMANDPGRTVRNAETWMMKARKLEKALTSDWMQENWPSPARTATLQ